MVITETSIYNINQLSLSSTRHTNTATVIFHKSGKCTLINDTNGRKKSFDKYIDAVGYLANKGW